MEFFCRVLPYFSVKVNWTFLRKVLKPGWFIVYFNPKKRKWPYHKKELNFCFPLLIVKEPNLVTVINSLTALLNAPTCGWEWIRTTGTPSFTSDALPRSYDHWATTTIFKELFLVGNRTTTFRFPICFTKIKKVSQTSKSFFLNPLPSIFHRL